MKTDSFQWIICQRQIPTPESERRRRPPSERVHRQQQEILLLSPAEWRCSSSRARDGISRERKPGEEKNLGTEEKKSAPCAGNASQTDTESETSPSRVPPFESPSLVPRYRKDNGFRVRRVTPRRYLDLDSNSAILNIVDEKKEIKRYPEGKFSKDFFPSLLQNNTCNIQQYLLSRQVLFILERVIFFVRRGRPRLTGSHFALTFRGGRRSVEELWPFVRGGFAGEN